MTPAQWTALAIGNGVNIHVFFDAVASVNPSGIRATVVGQPTAANGQLVRLLNRDTGSVMAVSLTQIQAVTIP